MSGRIERVVGDVRILGLSDLLSPREQSALAAVDVKPNPEPDPRALLEFERARMLESAHKEGYAAGIRDAEELIEKRSLAAELQWREKFEIETRRLAEASRALEALAATLPVALIELERRIEAAVVEIVFAATTRIVASAADDKAIVLGFCREALTEHTLRPAVLRVHPNMLSSVKSWILDEDVKVEGDSALAVGQCRIESARGLYDINLADRLEALKQMLLASIDDDVGAAPANDRAESGAASKSKVGAQRA
jgi:flagellar biosynthesis/type III secretory pathway protein FliH